MKEVGHQNDPPIKTTLRKPSLITVNFIKNLILYENNNYLTPYNKNGFFLNIYFSFYINI